MNNDTVTANDNEHRIKDIERLKLCKSALATSHRGDEVGGLVDEDATQRGHCSTLLGSIDTLLSQ